MTGAMESGGGRRVVVIGAGIVGVCCANALLKAGYSVEIVDPELPGSEGQCSYGNAGGICPGSCIGTPLRIQTISAERKFVASPMEGGLRLAGTVEFAGLAARPNMARADILLRQGRVMFPNLPNDPAKVKRWMGHRPGTPDSIPVIDRAPRHDNAVLAFGHGHQGLIAGAVTGRLVAELVAGRPASIDLSPFSATRF